MGTCKKSHNLTVSFFLVATLFLMWGIANNMNDTLVAAFKRILSMSDLQSSLVQFSFYGAYFCFALPASFFIQKYSYKAGIILGLILYACGTILFYPAGQIGNYIFFLIAIYVMASGCSVLETTANPYVMSMGSQQTATRRLNIAQAFNPIGAIVGILLSRHFILSNLSEADQEQRGSMQASALLELQHEEFNAISSTYLIIGCVLIILLAVIIFTLKRDCKIEDKKTTEKKGISVFTRLWNNKIYRYGIAAEFFYVGAQTGVWSFTIRIAMAELSLLEKEASLIFLYSIVAFSTMRFLLTWIMKYIRPSILLVYASISAFVCSGIVVFTNGATCIAALVLISGCMSIMFPSIYGLALEDIDSNDTKIASSGLIMSILGGALITPLQGYVSDSFDISKSYIIPSICFMLIFLYSRQIIKWEK